MNDHLLEGSINGKYLRLKPPTWNDIEAAIRTIHSDRGDIEVTKPDDSCLTIEGEGGLLTLNVSITEERQAILMSQPGTDESMFPVYTSNVPGKYVIRDLDVFLRVAKEWLETGTYFENDVVKWQYGRLGIDIIYE